MIVNLNVLFVTLLSFHSCIEAGSVYHEKHQIYDIPLDAQGAVKMYWSLDYPSSEVLFEIHFPTVRYGWFAIGFSDYGEYFPADYCVLWTDWKENVQLEDTAVNSEGVLFIDDKQDCTHFKYIIKHNVTKFTFSRKFDTCDDMDYIIEDGTTHIVWNRGSGPLYQLFGLNLRNVHKDNKGMVRTQLLKNIAVQTRLAPEALKHEVLADAVAVPSTDTTYWCHVHKLPSALQKKHHVIRYEAVIQKGNEPLVHHIELFHCVAPVNERIPNYQGSCFDAKRPNGTQVCKKVIAAWAMGATAFVYPEEAGFPVGGADFNLYVMLEIHYNNPAMRSDWVDSSGIRLYMTPSLRKYDSGVIELGLEYTDKMAIPPGQEVFTLSGYCITECTAVGLPVSGIIIFGSQLHTHTTGVRVYTRHIRDGRELPELNRDNHYSTHFQEIRRLKRPVRVLPGDALVTTCGYNTVNHENITLGGFAISDEMCVNYIHYYPASRLEVCKSSVSDETLHTYFRYLNDWEGQQTSVSKGISDNYKSIRWTPIRTQVLWQLYHEAPLSMQCNTSDGDRFSGYWANSPITPIYLPLPPPTRNCNKDTI